MYKAPISDMEQNFLYNLIVSCDFLFYYMSYNFSSLLVCSVFSMLANVCKHFILFTLEVDASEREPFNVKLYAENVCKHDDLLF